MELNSQKSTILLILITFFVISCNNDEALKINDDPIDFRAPVTKSYTLTEPKTIEWEVTDPDSIAPPKNYPLDIDKLPSKPFAVSEFKPFTSPMKEYVLDIDKIPETPLEFDTIPFTFKESTIPKPIIRKMDLPSFVEGNTKSLIEISESEGLPSDEIKVIIENDDGSFWIATHDGGLCLYNGEEIYIYGYYGIVDMIRDKDGKLWITSTMGLYVLDFLKNVQSQLISNAWLFRLYCDQENNIWFCPWNSRPFIMNAERTQLYQINAEFRFINRIWEDRNQNIWIGDQDHISIIGKDRKGYRNIEDTQDYRIGAVTTFFEDHLGNVWIDSRKSRRMSGTLTPSDRGLLSISLKDKRISTLDRENGFNGYAVRYQEDDLGRLWVFQNDTAFILNAARTEFKTITTDAVLNSFVRLGHSMKDSRGNIWIGSHNRGVVVIDPDGLMIESIYHLPGPRSDLSDIRSYEIDHSGHIWMGAFAGLYIYNPKIGQLKQASHEMLKTQNQPSGRFLRVVDEYEKDKFLIDAGSGFSILDRAKDIFTQFGPEQGFDSKLQNFLIDDSNNFWLSTLGGLHVINEVKNKFKKISTNTDLLPGSFTTDIIKDKFGYYWIATDAGLAIINQEENTIQYLGEAEGLCDNDVVKLLLQDDRYLWVATTNGLSIIDIVNQEITNLGENEGLIPNNILELREKEGQMYIGTVNGLIQTKKPTKINSKWHFSKYRSTQAVRGNLFRTGASMLRENGQLWFTAADLVGVPEVTIQSQDMTIDTVICPIAITSIHILDENQSFARWSELLPETIINDTLTYEAGNTMPQKADYLINNDIQYDSLSKGYKMPIGLTLPYDQNYLKFSFTNPCVVNREHISYRYMLRGVDDKWIYSGLIAESKNYINLSAGTYTFSVATKGITGQWGDPAEFSFQIIPPWWKTWWAYLGYILLVIGGIRTIVEYKSRKLKKENRLLEEKVAQRTTELRETIGNLKSTQAQLIQSEKMASLGELTAGIAHEIQNPLNFVNNFSDVSKELAEELKEEANRDTIDKDLIAEIASDIADNQAKIHHHGSRASSIVKGMLDHSRISSGEKELTDINQLTDEYLRLSYHGLRARDRTFNAKYETAFDESLPKINIVPQEIGRVILNLINNAFQAVSEMPSIKAISSLDPEVKVSTKNLEDQIQITVSDNGPGIPDEIKDKIFQPFFTTKPTGQGTGLGLSLSYDIVKAHGGELQVESEEGKGARFIIKLPLNSK